MSFISRVDPTQTISLEECHGKETPILPPKKYKEMEELYANVPNIRLNKRALGKQNSFEDVQQSPNRSRSWSLCKFYNSVRDFDEKTYKRLLFVMF